MDKITGKPLDIIAFLMGAEDKNQIYDLSPHKDVKKRSLDSNAYFHVLCDKLRQKLNISMARCKNHLIASYGQILYLEDRPMIYKTNAPEDYMMELETIHTKCVKVTEENGKEVFFYRVYRPSHEYNSAEFAKLLEGTISECKIQGIETATPDEIKHMQMLWEQKHGKHTDEDGLTVYLCRTHHAALHDKGLYDLGLQQEAQQAWMDHYNKTVKDFIERYGKSYL